MLLTEQSIIKDLYLKIKKNIILEQDEKQDEKKEESIVMKSLSEDSKKKLLQYDLIKDDKREKTVGYLFNLKIQYTNGIDEKIIKNSKNLQDLFATIEEIIKNEKLSTDINVQKQLASEYEKLEL